MARYVVGLTGGIASGKSEVSRRFEALGVVVADADVAAREVVAPGAPALSRIAETFGHTVLQDDGSLDRAALRQIVFASLQARLQLEAITHPAIRRRVRDVCEEAASPYAIAAIPLLAEAGGRSSYPWMHRVLVVDTPVELQLARLMRRDDIDQTLAQRMIDAQASRQQRLAIADDVIINDASADALQQPIEQLHESYLQLARAR